MGKERTEKSPYRSRYGGGFITRPQYLAELMCERLARRDRKGELPPLFWRKQAWSRTFILQVRHANALLALYSMEAVLAALETPSGRTLYSLGAGWLDGLVKEQEEKLQRRQERIPEVVEEERADIPTDCSPRPLFLGKKKSVLGKLRELDERGKEGDGS